MSNLLFQAVKELEVELISAGFAIEYKKPEHANSAFSVNLDSESYVGTVCYWPESTFEFQFNSCKTGNVALLETCKFHSGEALMSYFKQLILNRLV